MDEPAGPVLRNGLGVIILYLILPSDDPFEETAWLPINMAHYVLTSGVSGRFRSIEMKLPTKLAIVGVVLAGGTAAALLFRKTSTEQVAEPQAAAAPAPSNTAAPPEQAGVPQGVPLPVPASGNTKAAVEPSRKDSAEPAGSTRLPPRLADSFPAPKDQPATADAATKQPPPPLPNLRGALDTPVSLPMDRQVNQGKPAPAIVVPQPAPRPWRSHTVADGDTLSSLATRYLGSAGRFAEILEANRTVLRSADMLPIGIVLRIPPEAGPANMQTPVSEGTRFDHLVPIPAGALTSRSGS